MILILCDEVAILKIKTAEHFLLKKYYRTCHCKQNAGLAITIIVNVSSGFKLFGTVRVYLTKVFGYHLP
jgi:hypothetical protein